MTRSLLALALLLIAAPAFGQIPSLKAELERVRAQYGVQMTKDESVELLNAVLCTPKGDGFALVEKKRGSNGRRSDGALLSADGLVWTADRTFIDALADAGGNSRPNSRPAWQVHTIGQTAPSGNPYKPHTGPLVEPLCTTEPPPPEPPSMDCATVEGELRECARWKDVAVRQLEYEMAARKTAEAERDRLKAQLQEWDTRLQESLVTINELRQQLAGVSCKGWLPLGMFRVPGRCEVVR